MTRRKLRAEPRPILLTSLMALANNDSQNPSQLLDVFRRKMRVASPYSEMDPRHRVWAMIAWQRLMRITYMMRA